MDIFQPLKILESLDADEGLEAGHTDCPVRIFRGSGTPAVRCIFLFRRGYLYDRHNLEHSFLFHLLDKAHPRLSAEVFQEQLEDLGCLLSVSAGAGFSEVRMEGTSENMRAWLEAAGELFRGYHVRPEELNLQATLVERQIAQALARPATRVSYEARAWKFGPNIPGAAVPQPEDAHTMTAQALENLWKAAYPSTLMAVVLAGDIPEVFSTEWLHLPKPKKDADTLQPVLQAQHDEGHEIRVVLPRAQQASLRWLQRFPRIGDMEQYSRLRVALTLLGGFFGSRLMRKIREKEGLTYGIQASLNQHLEYHFLEIATEVDISRAPEALDLVNQTLKEMSHRPPSAEELEEVKNFMAGRIIAAYDGAMSRADRWLHRYTLGWTSDMERAYLKHLPQVTPEDIMKVSDTFFQPEKFTLIRSVTEE
ncbi:MAG: insulinase family protein [Flavobacteriales bacterium]|nr:insulinase family protein [Flavobacteriales bacterium]